MKLSSRYPAVSGRRVAGGPTTAATRTAANTAQIAAKTASRERYESALRETCCTPDRAATAQRDDARTRPPVTDAPTRQGRRWPWVVIGIYVAVQAVLLRAETWPVAAARINDYSVHIALVRWAAQRIAEGHLPLDGWFPDLGMGTPC